MRIAYICGSTSWGGLEMNQVKNAQWMQSFGEEVLVLCQKNSPTHKYCLEEQIPVATIDAHKKYYDFKAARSLKKTLLESRIEHVILRDVRDMSVVVLAKTLSKNSFKAHYFMEMQLGVSKKNVLHTMRFRGLDTWSCPLLWLQEQVAEKTKMDRNKTVHIPSALDFSPFTNDLSKEEALKELNLESGPFYLGLAGRFDPQKGQLLLLDALTQLNQPKIHVVFLGEPTAHEGMEYYNAMVDIINKHGLTDRVHIRPFRKDIAVFYKAIDAFVMASKAETVGMVTIEAMASGCVVIGSNAGGTPEILKAGKAGFLFTPLDATSLAVQIAYAFNNQRQFEPNFLRQQVEQFDYLKVIPQVIERLKNS